MRLDYSAQGGIDADLFLARHRAQLNDKHGVYAYSYNRDNRRHQRKVGKSYNIANRIEQHIQTHGNKSRSDPGAGIKIIYVETFDKRADDMSGEHRVDAQERALKQQLKKKTVKKRGSEVFEVPTDKLVEVMKQTKAKPKQQPRRQSERISRCLLWDTRVV